MNHLLNEIDRRNETVQTKLTEHEGKTDDFYANVDLSWIYHDNALEGVVLSFSELNAAIDDAIITDATLIPTYDAIRNHKAAITSVRHTKSKRKYPFDLDYLKKLHHILSHEELPRPIKAPPRPTPGQYRKDNPLHRMYFHEIAAPEKISYQMRKLVAWLGSDEAKKMPTVRRASMAHHRLISIYPWPRHSGKVARLLMNAMLLRENYLPGIIHAIERQRYYEVLRQSPEALTELVAESTLRTLKSAEQFFGIADPSEDGANAS